MPKTTARALPLSRKQYEALHARTPIVVFAAGRGSGKTWLGAYRIQSQAKDDDYWMAVSPDAGVTVETTLPTFVELAEHLGIYIDHVVSPYPRVWWKTQDGGRAQIVFRSAEKPNKLRGPNKSGLWLDEASYQPIEVLHVARATLRRGGVMGPTILTMTPRGRAHWTFDVCYEKCDEDDENAEIIQGVSYRRKPNAHLVQASTLDNPFLPAEFYDSMKADLSPLMAMQELEGAFLDIAGLMFKREWFPLVDAAPRIATRVRYWDRAASLTEESSKTAGALIARDPQGIIYIEDVVCGRWSPHERDTVILQTAAADAARYENEVLIYAEQEGGSGGKEVMQQLIRKLAGYPIYRDLASGVRTRSIGGVKLPGQAKITRAQGLAAQAENGNVRLVKGRWNGEYLAEMTAFPESSQSDQVDASSAGFNKVAQLTAPEETVATKASIGVDSSRFGKSLKSPASRKKAGGRRKIYNTE